MKEEMLCFGDIPVRTAVLHTVVVGSGAAGFNAALRLRQYGVEDIAVVTEGIAMGTSRNTGSDKQTYYKLSLCGNSPDSPAAMAKDLFAGRCVDGDIAYAEAALSIPCFLHLAELGVPFPVNRYGEYVGYKTDHDPRMRATSAGPLTSQMMTQCLEKAVLDAQIPLFDHCMIISILTENERAVGLLALDTSGCRDEFTRFRLFRCENIIYAAGGPAGIYADTVYPAGHYGSSGIAFEAGVRGRNLTEWQYGLASTAPRWNVSGTYMQVLPRFVSVDPDGGEHEFLKEYYPDAKTGLSKVFRKGYEWPFDIRKTTDGSSVIDLLVYREQVLRGRQVFLDFRANPYGLENLPYEDLDREARDYLSKADACFGVPVERLLHMNAPAYALYLSKGVDLKKEQLPIALCAQHNNGGLAVDCWWQTNIRHFFATGEAAGTHGVYRPGGSALNAGQVGSMRAAQYIAYHQPQDPPLPDGIFIKTAGQAVAVHSALCRRLLEGGEKENLLRYERACTRRMSASGGPIRSCLAMKEAREAARLLLTNFVDILRVGSAAELPRAYRLRDLLISQVMYLTAMEDYAATGGKSRGSALYTSASGQCDGALEPAFRFEPDDGSRDGMIQEIRWHPGGCAAAWRPVRPLPEGGGFFETVWRRYRETKNVD